MFWHRNLLLIVTETSYSISWSPITFRSLPPPKFPLQNFHSLVCYQLENMANLLLTTINIKRFLSFRSTVQLSKKLMTKDYQKKIWIWKLINVQIKRKRGKYFLNIQNEAIIKILQLRAQTKYIQFLLSVILQ